jgi:hypothetical protein
MNPKRIIDYLEQKEKDLNAKKNLLKNILPDLEKQQKLEHTEAIIYEGFKAVTNLFKTILDDLNKNEEYYVIGAGYGETPNLKDFFYNYHNQRADKKIKVKMLANYDIKENLEPTTKKYSEIKYLPKYLITNMEIVFYKDKALILLWATSPIAFEIKSKEIANGFNNYFNAFWKIAKP